MHLILKKNKLRVDYLFVYLVMLTSSFDIVGNINIGGMTFRCSWIFIFFLFLYLIITNIRLRKNKINIWLLFFLILQTISLINSPNFKFGVGYLIWLFIDVVFVFALQSIFKSEIQLYDLLRLYISSFVFLSCIGILQFILSIFGINFFLTQPTLNGSFLPRLNAFTYEPSYYSTYLIPGWIIVCYLYERGSSFFAKKELKIAIILITFALLFSTSRMGWICMFLWIFIRTILMIKRTIKDKIKKKHFRLFIILFLAIIICIICFITIINTPKYHYIIDGLGISGTADFSSGQRTSQFIKTLKLFRIHPLLGVGIGGVPALYCNTYHMSFDSGASMCVWIELLVAGGIIGTIPFCIWIYNIVLGVIKNAKKNVHIKNECFALVWSFIFECFILAMNQNILRVYFWILLGVLCTFSHFTASISEQRK